MTVRHATFRVVVNRSRGERCRDNAGAVGGSGHTVPHDRCVGTDRDGDLEFVVLRLDDGAADEG
jgi:hypothetical protein